MAVIERVEELRELKSMLGEIRRLRSGDALTHDVGRFRRSQPESPEFIGVLTRQKSREVRGRGVTGNVPTESVGIDSGLLEDASRADYRVLRVGAGFAFVAERLFEVEGY